MKRLFVSFVLICSLVIIFSAPNPSFGQTRNPGKPVDRVDVAAPAVAGQFVVKFKATTEKANRSAALKSIGAVQIDRIAALDAEVIEVATLKSNDTRAGREAVLASLKQNPNVEYAEPNFIYSMNFTPNDPSLSSQWAWGVIQAYTGWDITQGSSSVVIAVVDTGIQSNHPDLDAKMVAGYDYIDNDATPADGNGHGTHVAGTSAAETNNSTGGAGTCPNCKLMPVRVLNNSGSGTLAGVANGITYAADNGAKVINLSLGGGGSTALQNAVDYAWGRGVFLACAAGNSNTSSVTNSYPAAYTNCFAVASTTSSDARSSFSNYGSWVEVAAPGSSIYSTWINSGYNTINGTSMATPHVAGLAGLLASQGLSNSQIRDRICSTSDAISGTGSSWTCGRINVYRAVNNGGTTPTPTPNPTTPTVVPPTATPPPGGGSIVNGGFESGTTGWTQASSGGYSLIDTTRPRTGSYSVYMGGYNNANEGLYQTVTVPAGSALNFYWYQTSNEGTTTAYDYLRVRVYNTSGTLLGTLATRSNVNTENAWVAESLSLAAYAGQTVRIRFETTTDSSLTTSFFVDDVSLQ
ncbi:S8 family serine peptidase [Herpetosiphon sp. NSE202]|uniref:S8 family serine peptidase n=1 Tax=Herpetosiphon sp. NSE202 TaxID=3351349 RepID=UPI003631A491